MNHLILASFTSSLFGVLLSVMAIFLILLVLVQRGRGGGLAGALGGMGGSSAFGAKAGDVFTRITIVAAAIWIVLCIAAAKWGSAGGSRINVTTRSSGGAATATPDPGKTGDSAAAPAGKSAEAPASKSDAAPPAEGASTASPAATPESAPAESAPTDGAPADASPAAPQSP